MPYMTVYDVQQLNEEQLPLGHHNVVHTVIDAHSRRFTVVRAEGVVHDLTIDKVGTRFSVGKSSVLYLCFRLTLERGWLRHLLCGQMGIRQTLLGGSRSGGFCTVTDEIRGCTEGKIRLTGKGSRGISRPTSRRSEPH